MKTDAIFIVKNGSAATAFDQKQVELSPLKDNEVLIESEGFGLNYADVMARLGLYQDAPPLPFVPGYEVVGKIVGYGSDADPSLVGKRVMAFCRFGGYAKHVKTIVNAITIVDEDSPAEELLALCTQGVTAYYMAEYLSPVHASDTVLIHAAAGGVGSLLVQLAKAKGATVIAKVGNDEKKEFIYKLGADHAINYKENDYFTETKKILNGGQLDVSFNPVAGSTYKKDLKLLGAGGRLILFGASELGSGKFGALSKINFVRRMGLMMPIKLVMISKSILGVNMLRIADNKPDVLEVCLKEVFNLYAAGKLTPQVGGKYSVSDLSTAHSALESGQTTGKLSVFWD